jgi:formyl-CoA transferase
VWGNICDVIGEEDWKTKEGYATPPERLDKLNEIFERIEQWTMTKTKFEVMDICNPLNIPVGPDPQHEGNRRRSGTARHRHDRRSRSPGTRRVPDRGDAGEAVRLSSRCERSPLLGEHTDEILEQVLGYSTEEIEQIRASGAVGDIKQAAE